MASGVVKLFDFNTVEFVLRLMIMHIKMCQTIAKLVPNSDENTRTILLWNALFDSKKYGFGFGETPFNTFRCKVRECYITNERDYMLVNQFDAIVFHIPQYSDIKKEDAPSRRSPHQVYVFFNNEAPVRYPIFKSLNGVFNLTMTYRIDSDIILPYLKIARLRKRIISPSNNPNWMQPNTSNLQQYKTIFDAKSKAIVWYVSNCRTESKREKYVSELAKYITVDIYGACAPQSCEKNCGQLIKQDYFFYLAFENSLCADYMTEKVTIAMKNDAIPVLYGGADANKFLPPNSYIDATKYSPKDLSALLKSLISDRSKYIEYFWWKNYYKFVNRQHPFCTLCEFLHGKQNKNRIYDDVLTWWHGDDTSPTCKPANESTR